MKKKKHQLLSRRKFFYTSLLGTMAASYSYARYAEPYQLSITRRDIVIPDLPPALDGVVIAQLTDFHYQHDIHDALITEAISVTNSEKPDIIALTGDYITNDENEFPPLLPHFAKLNSKHGIYAVLGNHDAWHGRMSVFEKGFQQAGIEFLNNQGTSIRIRNEKLFIAGTNSALAGWMNLPSCFKGHNNEPVLALIHEPDVFDETATDYPVSLQLSGHTHGGQCRVPFIGYAPIKVPLGKKYIYGEHKIGDSSLFVSRGIGTTALDVRFACPPEVAFLTLRSALAST